MTTPAPTIVGKYRIEREIGRGASSTVFLGYDNFNRRHVAIKQIHTHLLTDPHEAQRYRRRLRNEAMLVGQLNHPHIVRLLDADEDADPPYLVLEYIEGNSLASFTTPDRLLPVAQVLDIAFKCCHALEHAQQRGLVHRDVKPANLILQDSGDIKVTDFGTALSYNTDETQLMGLVGSPSYMSPEQVREEACTHRSDMFSLGVVIYEMLTGRRPFDGDSDYATLYRISTEDPSPPSLLRTDLPPHLDRVLLRAMAKDPVARYDQWSDFADALLAVNRSMPVRRDQDREGERFAQLRNLAFFKDFPDAALWEALRLGTIATYAPGDTLMKENTPGESFCVILDGSVAVTRHGRKLVTLGAGVTLGEMAYLQPDHPMRSAGAVASTDVVVLEIRNTALRRASDELQTRFDRVFISLLVKRLIATTASLETLAAAKSA
jgi:serine/threonine protein kinase